MSLPPYTSDYAEWQPSRAEVLLESNRINFGRVRLFASILLAFHCFLLHRDLTVLRAEGYWERNIGYQHLYKMHVLFVVAMAVFLLLSPLIKRLGEEKTCVFYHGFNIGFAMTVLLWCAVLAGWVNQHEHGLITEYIIALFGISAALSFPPVQTLVMFASAQIVFMLAVASMLPEPNVSGHYTNSIIMVILAWVLARSSFLLNINNITKQKIIQSQTEALAARNGELQQTNLRLEQLDNERVELMGIVAHDLKNPLTNIMLATEVGEMALTDGDMRKIAHVQTEITKSARRMLDLIRNLLDMNRIESGAIRFQMKVLDVVPVLESLTEQYSDIGRAKNITLHLVLNAPHMMVSADEQILVQVLDNLISNAVKYSPYDKNIFIRLKASNEAVRVEVQDEGPGISEEDMKKLFGKFARLSAQPTGGEHSTGLGLSIVKKMVEAMNGKVWCESELGKGATFIVEFPL